MVGELVRKWVWVVEKGEKWSKVVNATNSGELLASKWIKGEINVLRDPRAKAR